MNFPGDILKGISRFFDGDGDEILLYILVFLFFFLTGNRDGNNIEDESMTGRIIPIILIIVFLLFSHGNRKIESSEATT